MYICELFPHTLDYFLLDEKLAEDVIYLICLMQEKGRGMMPKPDNHVMEKKVFADQANWY